MYRNGSRIGTMLRELGRSPTWAVHGNMHFASTAPVAGPKIEKNGNCVENKHKQKKIHKVSKIQLHPYLLHYTRSTCFDWQKRKYITTSRVVSEIQENLQGYAIPSKLSFEKNSLTTNSLQLSTGNTLQKLRKAVTSWRCLSYRY